MSTYDRAETARRLIADDGLQTILDEIVSDAASVFINHSATIDQITAAHEKVRAVGILRTAFNARITDETFEKRKRDQHRV